MPKLTVNLSVSGICNLNCSYCNLNFDKDFMELDTFIDIVERHGKDGYYIITGGEPTLHPDIGRMIAYLEDNGYEGQIITNGYRLKRFLPNIKRLQINLSISALTVANMDEKDGLTLSVLPYLKGKKVALSPIFRNDADDALLVMLLANINGFSLTQNVNIHSAQPSIHYHHMEDINIPELERYAHMYEEVCKPDWFVRPETLWELISYHKENKFWRCDPAFKKEFEWFYRPDGSYTHCCLWDDVDHCGGCLDLCGLQASK